MITFVDNAISWDNQNTHEAHVDLRMLGKTLEWFTSWNAHMLPPGNVSVSQYTCCVVFYFFDDSTVTT
jgi:hypothetical protein